MEWRVFVPFEAPTTGNAVEQQMYSILESAINDLRRYLFSSTDVESRDDDYIVVTRHVGLKFRHGKKLEIKLLKNIARNGAETWKKRKFKKSPLSEQVDTVIEHLASEGYSRIEEARQRLEEGHAITVSKSRVNVLGTVNENMLEFAQISTTFPHEFIPAGVTVPTTKSWISLAVEGFSEEDIQREVHENVVLRRFLAAVAQVNNLSAQSSDAQQRANYCSIFGGYPFFVQYISGKAESIDLEESLLLLQQFA